ncbi:tetratricopeptide repeat protein, partial [bacterium]
MPISLRYSPIEEGMLAAGCCNTGQIRLIYGKYGEQRNSGGFNYKGFFYGHDQGVVSLEYSPNGKKIVSGSRDNTVRIWDVESRKCEKVFNKNNYKPVVLCAACSSDGKILAIGTSNNSIELWDMKKLFCKKVLEVETKCVNYIAFGPDHKTIAWANSACNTIFLWNKQTNKHEILSQKMRIPYRYPCINYLAYSPDGKTIVAVIYTGSNIDVHLLDVKTRKTEIIYSSLYNNDISISASWSQTYYNKILALTFIDRILFFDIKTKKVLTERTVKINNKGLEGCSTIIGCLPEQTIAAGYNDGSIQIRDTRTGEVKKNFIGDRGQIKSLVYTQNGGLLSVRRDKTVLLLDVRQGTYKKIIDYNERVTCVAYCPDGKTVASASSNGLIYLWNLETGELKTTLRGHNGCVHSIMFSPDCRTIVSGGSDNTIRFWGVENGNHKAIVTGHTGEVLSVKYSPDGKRIATASEDHSCKIWDVSLLDQGKEPRLICSTYNATLFCEGVNIKGVKMLSNANMKLLRQNGAKGEPSNDIGTRYGSIRIRSLDNKYIDFRVLEFDKKIYEQLIRYLDSTQDYPDDYRRAKKGYQLGFLYYKSGDNKKAIEYYSYAIKLYPKPLFYYNRGLVYYKTGKNKEAIEDYSTAIRSVSK